MTRLTFFALLTGVNVLLPATLSSSVVVTFCRLLNTSKPTVSKEANVSTKRMSLIVDRNYKMWVKKWGQIKFLPILAKTVI